MELSIIIPARNEEGTLRSTLTNITSELAAKDFTYEIIVVNDNSNDSTEKILKEFKQLYPNFRYFNNPPPNGIGSAIRKGLQHFAGDAIAIVMADGSDSPKDIVQYALKIQEGYDCVFGSRFINGGEVIDYPKHKLILNRLANWFIQILFNLPYNDITNAFKCYRKEVIQGIHPLVATHFNILVEMPLKAIAKNYNYAVVPICWSNRKHGISKLRIREMSIKYLSTIFNVYKEKYRTSDSQSYH